MNIQRLAVIAGFLCLLGVSFKPAWAQTLSKPQVSDLIRKVEDGVDEFKKYLEGKGDTARSNVSNAQAQRQASGRTRQPNTSADTKDAGKARAQQGSEQLNSALDDLNKSTNRLRRRFNKAGNYMETKAEVDSVVNDGKRINDIVAKGNYGSQVAKVWATLRTQINQLARAYGVAPLRV